MVKTTKASLAGLKYFAVLWHPNINQPVLTGINRADVFGSYEPDRFSQASVAVHLDVQPPLSRPVKNHLICASWGAALLRRVRGDDAPQCAKENEMATFLSTLYASTGENYGIIKALKPFKNKLLEGLRIKSIYSPWCAFSLWVLLVKPCSNHLCGLLHHIDAENDYATPAMFLTNTGQIHVQLVRDSGQPSAFLSPFKVPLGQWCRISMEILGRLTQLSIACTDGQQQFIKTAEHVFDINPMLDDTHGYFVIGGGKFTKGIEGYYGPTKFFRTKGLPADPAEIQLPDIIAKVNITGWLQSCQKFKSDLFFNAQSTVKTLSDRCLDVYTDLVLNHGTEITTERCTFFESPTNRYRRQVARLAKILTQKHGNVLSPTLGRVLYSLVLRKLKSADGLEVINRLMPFLLQSGCLGDNRALHLSSVLYSSGFGVKKQPYKAWLLSLLAAQDDWRLALLRLGHMHHVGDLDVTPDHELSYAYYINIARQTTKDHKKPTQEQTFVELIRLNDEETLKAQTSENDDLFHWLKLQARSGVAEAEQAMGRMLFWGQQGVSPDIQTAVKHYERGATRLHDPVSAYDYAIVLLTGQGVQQNVQKAVTFLNKAVEQGFVPAITALGWYYEQFERDYEKAALLWKEADAKGHPDAAMNLGVLYSQALGLDGAIIQFKAFQCYLRSAQRGHMNGGIALADVWIHGIPGQVARRPEDAVLWAKWASEQNGYLGTVLRKGLNAHLKGDWMMSLIYYLNAAESGFEGAQFNVAYLCELNSVSLTPHPLKHQCLITRFTHTSRSSSPTSFTAHRHKLLLYHFSVSRQMNFFPLLEVCKQGMLQGHMCIKHSLGEIHEPGESVPSLLYIYLSIVGHHLLDVYIRSRPIRQQCGGQATADDVHVPCTLNSSSSSLSSSALLRMVETSLWFRHIPRSSTANSWHSCSKARY
ncbi:Protein sel-1 -like protein 3 [Triplophysa tibetana]|uniref:Protein sel-1-like protein 3 n=1 Tax=Triplophysa tibetana TaxID=1572043 RepID=A0A5A9MUB7_9TELE|nr:Protein sel-1 -like protein 3 [Triplophysa tibetana]